MSRKFRVNDSCLHREEVCVVEALAVKDNRDRIYYKVRNPEDQGASAEFVRTDKLVKLV